MRCIGLLNAALTCYWRGVLCAMGAAAIVTGCAHRQPDAPGAAIIIAPESPPASPPVASEETAGPPTRAEVVQPPWSIDDYKREVARRISQISARNLYEGAPPPMLKSIVVLSLVVDADGRPRRVSVLRSNGFRALERAALQSVQDAAPLPRPGALVSWWGMAEFTETWLFRHDGRFQLRSLAEAQADSGG